MLGRRDARERDADERHTTVRRAEGVARGRHRSHRDDGGAAAARDGDGDGGAAARDVPRSRRSLAGRDPCAAPLPIATEPPVRARSSEGAIGLELLTSGDENPGPGLVEGFEGDAGADRVDSPGLVPSRNSAFTAVRVSDGGAVDDATGGTFFGGQLRGSGGWLGPATGAALGRRWGTVPRGGAWFA